MGKVWNVAGIKIPATVGIILVVAAVLQFGGFYDFGQLFAAAGVGTNGVVCDNEENRPLIQYTGYLTDHTNNNQKSPVTDWVRFAIPGEALARLTTTFVGTNSTTEGDLACGTNYNVILGNGGNVSAYYFKAITTGVISDSLLVLPEAELIEAGAPSMSVSNSTSFEGTQVELSNASYAAATWGTATAKLNVIFPADGDTFGDEGWAVCFRWNPVNMSDVAISGSTGGWNQIAVVGGTTHEQTSVKCYEMPKHSPRAVEAYTVSFRGGSSFTPNVWDRVDVYLLDITNVLFNGNMYRGSDNGVGSGLATDVGLSNPNLLGAFVFREG